MMFTKITQIDKSEVMPNLLSGVNVYLLDEETESYLDVKEMPFQEIVNLVTDDDSDIIFFILRLEVKDEN